MQPPPAWAALGGLWEGCLCFLCAAGPRYRVTAHMLTQQLWQPLPAPGRARRDAALHSGSEANDRFSFSSAKSQLTVTEISPFLFKTPNRTLPGNTALPRRRHRWCEGWREMEETFSELGFSSAGAEEEFQRSKMALLINHGFKRKHLLERSLPSVAQT